MPVCEKKIIMWFSLFLLSQNKNYSELSFPVAYSDMFLLRKYHLSIRSIDQSDTGEKNVYSTIECVTKSWPLRRNDVHTIITTRLATPNTDWTSHKLTNCALKTKIVLSAMARKNPKTKSRRLGGRNADCW